MLESLVSFEEINERPYLMFFWAFVICAVAIFISYRVPLAVGVDSGFLSVLFTIIPSIFFITSLIKQEEEIEENEIEHHRTAGFWYRHEKDIMILLFFFAGLTAAFSLARFFLPSGFFHVQEATICRILGLSGCAGSWTGVNFTAILTNNVQVLLLSFLFSFIFGAGAIFIITWNASILGVRIAQLSQEIWHAPITTLVFIPHGLPEIAGYLCAGLAGGLLSASIIRKNRLQVLKTISADSLKILALGVALIFLGAAVEAYL